MEVTTSPIKDENGKIVQAIHIQRDITKRKQDEETLREREQFIRKIIDTVDEGFIVIDRDYRIITSNKSFCSQMGVSDEKIIGTRCYEVLNKEVLSGVKMSEDCPAKHVFATGQANSLVRHQIDADGNALYIEIKAYPNKDASGNVASAIVTINDITEKNLLEAERLKTQKLESIGNLAGGLAHDFNNLLTTILGNISLARLQRHNLEKLTKRIDDAERATIRAKDLTQQLLTFAKGGEPIKKIISIGHLLKEAAGFALHGSAIQCKYNFAEDLWPVEADEGQLSQVIHNLILNAVQAMENGGTIIIGAKNVDSLLAGERFLEITVTDSGSGIPEQELAKIFDPYYTTKEQGNGLGLATSYSIITKHGGKIKATSTLGVGTTFYISLPAAVQIEDTIPAACLETAYGKGHILVMDDEEAIREIVTELLDELGYQAESVEDGNEAIELYRRRQEEGTPFAAVIMDLTIPGGMGGKQSITSLIMINPKIKAVVSSGYASDPVMANFRDYGFSAVLSKPYQVQELSTVLQELLKD